MGRRAGFSDLPVWARLVAAISAMLAVTWSLMIVPDLCGAARRHHRGRRGDFAESMNQMTVATLTGMMITGVSKERAVFLDQVRESNNIKDLKVLRFGIVITQYGAGAGIRGRPPRAEEKAVMKSGKPSFSVNENDGYLQRDLPDPELAQLSGQGLHGLPRGQGRRRAGRSQHAGQPAKGAGRVAAVSPGGYRCLRWVSACRCWARSTSSFAAS